MGRSAAREQTYDLAGDFGPDKKDEERASPLLPPLAEDAAPGEAESEPDAAAPDDSPSCKVKRNTVDAMHAVGMRCKTSRKKS
jgi:hypothetical protein